MQGFWDVRGRRSAVGGRKPHTAGRLLLTAAVATCLAGCHTDMWRQPKISPLEDAEPGMFVDGSSARPLVPGTVARGFLRDDQAFYTGIGNGRYLDAIPMKVDRDLLQRGRERFDIYCTPCHGRLGDGEGMIAHRGLALRRPPASYHTDRLRKMPVGYFYDVITNGYGAMYSYASRVEPHDRWAIIAYIRALQLSQHAPSSDADPAALAQTASPASPTANVSTTPPASETIHP